MPFTVSNPIGKKGEDVAVEYLRKKGYKIIERNYRKHYGEIDIIAIDSNSKSPSTHFVRSGKNEPTLVFIEVKTRTSNQFGTPLEAITPWKLQPLIKTAQLYTVSHKGLPERLRMDAIAVTIDDTMHGKVEEHVKNISGF